MDRSLKSKTLRGLFWSFCERISQQSIQFIILIILARLLLPEQFGLIGMLTFFMAIAQSLIDSGFGSALIQKKDTTYVDECSVFYFNILLGFLVAGLLCFVAPWIADFYNQPLLIPLTRVLSLNLVVNAFGLVQTTLLTKHLDFKTQLKVSVITTIFSGTIGIVMAFNGFGVWSLVAQSFTSSLFRTILLWFFNTWRPSLLFSLRAMREMFGFSSRILASGLLYTVFRNIYLLVIGRLFSPAALGFYSQAERIQQLPTENFSAIISRVTFPVFSAIQDDSNRLKSGMRKALTTMAIVNIPMMIGLAIVARPLVLVLLTERWIHSIPYLQLLCIVGLLHPLHVINLNMLVAKGRSELLLRLEIIKKILIIVSIAATYRWGIIAMIYGQIVVTVICYYLNSYYTSKLINYPIKEQVLNLAPYLIMGMVMGIGVYSVRLLQFSSKAALLLSQVLMGIVTYGVLCFCFRLDVFMEVCDMLLLQRETLLRGGNK
jgi:teichuronic acid exporter